MSEQRSRKHHDFDEALRRWAERPPRTPAPEAARRIEARLPGRRGAAGRSVGAGWGSRWGVPLAAAAVLVLAVGLAVVFAPPRPLQPAIERSTGRPGTAAETPLAAEAPPAPAGDVLVIDLDERTTLYMNLAPAG